MDSGPRTGRVAPSAMLLAALLMAGLSVPASNVARAGVVITDTTVALDPSDGSRSTPFTATLTYTPRGELCPPTATTVSFTWDGYDLGTATMQTGASPCRATLPTKPLAGYTSAGTHQVCGTFQSQGTHKGCAPFKVASSPSASQSHPSTSAPKSQGGSTPTPGSVSSSKPAPSRTSTDVPRSPTPATTSEAAPAPKEEKTAGNGPLVGAAIGVLILLVALWLPVSKRLRRSS